LWKWPVKCIAGGFGEPPLDGVGALYSGWGLGSGSGLGCSGFGCSPFLGKWLPKCFLIGPQMVTDAHSADGWCIFPGTATKLPSASGVILDGSCPGHAVPRCTVELCEAFGAVEIDGEGYVESAGAFEFADGLAHVLTIVVLALDRHLKT